jgi:hypothetical protein
MLSTQPGAETLQGAQRTDSGLVLNSSFSILHSPFDNLHFGSRASWKIEMKNVE